MLQHRIFITVMVDWLFWYMYHDTSDHILAHFRPSTIPCNAQLLFSAMFTAPVIKFSLTIFMTMNYPTNNSLIEDMLYAYNVCVNEWAVKDIPSIYTISYRCCFPCKNMNLKRWFYFIHYRISANFLLKNIRFWTINSIIYHESEPESFFAWRRIFLYTS